MTDYYQRVTDEQDFFKKILGKIPGFSGYAERSNRRSADKLLRETIATQFESLWQRTSELQRSFISEGEIEVVDDIEAAAIKLRQFIDRIKNAAYGYAGFFDAIKVKQEELAAIYEYDLHFLDLGDEVASAIDNIQSSVGTDGLPASIRNLVSLAQSCIDTFEKRKEVILSLSGESES
ncbi:MAG: hypothetical protein GYA52_11755 [Chloroflexi bacterium]|jgi:hypothetical protein|nr:hypothetical protein [Chloroflexota bacterium]